MTGYFTRLQRFPVYGWARFYCFSCGFSVVPLWPQTKAQVLKGNSFQTWFPDDAHLQQWFCNAQGYGIAIVPGEVSGNLVIIDFDAPGSFDAWYAQTGIETPRVRSGRGVHVYVRLQQMVSNGKARFEGQIVGDVIAHGNITAPPSVHASGKVYQWHGDPRRIPLFSCLAGLSVERIAPVGSTSPRKPLPQQQTKTSQRKIQHPAAYVQVAVMKECELLLKTPVGQRNHQLFQSAMKLAKYEQVISEQAIIDGLTQTALQAGMDPVEDKIAGTIRSGLRRGLANGMLCI